jgi:glycosyltransferase involved in cell wall biosynthesis/O-antigen/teichoic acid export membrane protein
MTMDSVRNRNLGKSVVVVGITAAISQLLSVGYLIFLARWVGPEIYGIHVGIFNLCAISIFFVSWGLDTWLLKTTSEDQASSSTVLKKVLLLKLGFGIIWAAALFVIAPMLRPEIFLRDLLFLAIVSTLSESLTNSIFTVLLTTDRFRQSSIILLVGRLFRLLSLLGLVFLSVKDLNSIIASRTVIDFVVLLVAGGVFGLGFSGWRFDLSSLKQTFTDAIPYHASDLVNIIFRQVDVTLVTFMSRSLVTISNYSLMISFFNVISTIVLSLMNVIVPSLSRDRNISAGTRRKALIRTVFGFLILGLVGWAAIVLFGQQAISLILGDKYALVADLISRTAIIVLISSLNVGLVAIIIANNRQKQRLVPQIISLVFKVVASLLIFPLSQVEGLRLIYILSEVVLSIGYLVVVSGVFSECNQESTISWEEGKKLKIALLTFNQEGRGTYLRAYMLGKQLAKLGHDVTILAGNIEGRSALQREEDGLKIVTFPRLFKRFFLSGWGLDELISRSCWARHQTFDLVHAFETRPTNLIPGRLMQRKGAAFFVDWADWLGRGGSVEERPDGIKKYLLRIFETWYENRKFSESDGITAICSPLAAEAKRRGYPDDKILLLPNGMSNPYLKSVPLEQAREEMGLPSESFIIGYIGSGFKKDMDLMYSAFSLLQEKLEDVKLLHVGRSNYHTPLNEDIIRTGNVTDEEASYYLSACDLFWFPLRKTKANLGRLPLKLSDYLTIGRPIVSTDIGDLAEWIQNLGAGVVADDDAQSISRMVVELSNSFEQRAVMSCNASDASKKAELSWRKRAEELEKFYFSRMNEVGKSSDLGDNDL